MSINHSKQGSRVKTYLHICRSLTVIDPPGTTPNVGQYRWSVWVYVDVRTPSFLPLLLSAFAGRYGCADLDGLHRPLDEASGWSDEATQALVEVVPTDGKEMHGREPGCMTRIWIVFLSEGCV